MKKKRNVKSTKKSSSFVRTDPLSTQKVVLDLGRALVKQLDLDPGVDTLGRWMAHYIVELIEAAETAKIDDRPAKLKQCADAIKGLWKHRHELPDGKRPFEDFEPILRALESLDPANKTSRYYPSQRMAVGKTKQNAGAQKWLDVINGLDYSARILIRYCLVQAAQAALDKSQKWVALAQAAGMKDDFDIPVIRIITKESELTGATDPDESARKQLQDRIDRLTAFVVIAQPIIAGMRQQLAKIKPPIHGEKAKLIHGSKKMKQSEIKKR